MPNELQVSVTISLVPFGHSTSVEVTHDLVDGVDVELALYEEPYVFPTNSALRLVPVMVSS